MSKGKAKYPRFTSPKGVAVFPWLNKPDTKFKEQGEYRTKLRMSAEDAEPLIAKLQPLFDAAVAEAKKNPKRKGKKIAVNDFYTTVVDDDGNETGEVEFNFKRTASGISKKTNEPWAVKPDLFDAKGQPLRADAKIYGGSILKVSFDVMPYDTPQGTGIKLSLAAVQVIKLVEGNRNASTYGFGDESDDDDADEVENNDSDDEDSDATSDDEEDF